MKRLNPDTGKPFVRGDTRADGFLFRHYRMQCIKKDGFFEEQWYSPRAFENRKLGGIALHKKNKTKPHSRALTLIGSAKARCRKRNVGNVSITKDWVEAKLISGICELTGLPFDLTDSIDYHTNPYAPSLDRIDNSNPDYSESNTRVVLSLVNKALGESGLDVLIHIMQALVEKQTIA